MEKSSHHFNWCFHLVGHPECYLECHPESHLTGHLLIKDLECLKKCLECPKRLVASHQEIEVPTTCIRFGWNWNWNWGFRSS